MGSGSQTGECLLEMRAISKSFPGVRALKDVTLDLRAGEIHALVGENGAGKSTLMKILGGVYSHYDGEIRIDGQVRRFRNVQESQHAGVAVVFQELSLVRELTVGENIFLGREPGRGGIVSWHELYSRADTLLRSIGLTIDAYTELGKLGAGRQQLVEIAKALSQNARILVLDEPTAALTDVESEHLFSVLEHLRARGLGIIYISHRLEEVFRLSDRISVLRDGETVGTTATSETNQADVIARMVGRELSHLFPTTRRTGGNVCLEVRGLSAETAAGKRVLDNVSFQVRRGEVLGVAGLMGAGRTELLSALFGSLAVKRSGEVLLEGDPVAIRTPADAIARGIGFVTEDRKGSGLVLDQTILSNMTLASLRGVLTDEAREISSSAPLFRDLKVKANSLFTVVRTLSGGNQQKVVLAKWLMTRPKVLFLDEPTRGIDVGAKQEFYGLIDRLAQSGMAVVLVSSELPEVLGLSDRILVLHEGRVTGEFSRESATPEAVMACATGQISAA